MTISDERKLSLLSIPSALGFLILAYDYCAPGLARIPSIWNEIIGRYLFIACFLGGAVTAVLALAMLKSKWEGLDGLFKSGIMVINFAWLGTIAYLAVQMHLHYAQH